MRSQFIKGRCDEIGDNRKGFFEEGMTEQKSEEIAFKQAKRQRRGFQAERHVQSPCGERVVQ